MEGQRPAGGRPLPGGGTCGRSGARGRQRGPAPPCRDCTRRGSGRHAFGRRSRAATSGPSSRSRTRTPPSAGCQLPPPPRPVRASRVEGRERVRQSPLRIAAGKKDIVFQRPPVCITSHVRSTPSADRAELIRNRSAAARPASVMDDEADSRGPAPPSWPEGIDPEELERQRQRFQQLRKFERVHKQLHTHANGGTKRKIQGKGTDTGVTRLLRNRSLVASHCPFCSQRCARGAAP